MFRRIVLSLLILISGCARSPQSQRDLHLTRGKDLFNRRDYARAILEFKSAIQAIPTDAESYYQLGMAYAASGDPKRSYATLQKAVQLNPRHPQARLKLAELMASLGDRELIREAESDLKTLAATEPANREVANSLALSELKLGKADDAIESLSRSLERSPNELASSILLALAKLSNGDPRGAEQALIKACTNEPKSPDPYIALGEFYLARHQGKDAEAEFQRALRLDPKKYPALFDLAVLESAAGRKQEAEENFRRLSAGGQPEYKPVHAQFLFEENRRAEAVGEFEELAASDPSDRAARTRLIASYLAVNRISDAESVIAKTLKANPRDVDALQQRAMILEVSGRYVEAERVLNEVLHSNPSSGQAHYLLAEMQASRGDTLRARDELSEALRLDPNLLQARVDLAGIYRKKKDPESAIAVLNKAPEGQGNSVRVLEEKVWALLQSGNTAEARNEVDRGLRIVKSPGFLIQDGILKLRAGNVSAARSSAEEALQIEAGDVRAYQLLYSTYSTAGAEQAGLEKLQQYAAKAPQSASAQEFVGTVLVRRHQYEKARVAFLAAKAAAPGFDEADFSLVQVDVLENKLDDARSRLKSIHVEGTAGAVAHLWLGIVDRTAGEQAAALEEFRTSANMDGRNAEALNNLAFTLAEYGNAPDEALNYAQRACELDPDQPDYADTLGWILYRKGLYSTAVHQLESAVSRRKTDALMEYHLAMAYAKGGDLKRGRLTYETAFELNPNLPEAQMADRVLSEAERHEN